MAKLRPCDPHLQISRPGSFKLTPSGAEKRHRKPDNAGSSMDGWGTIGKPSSNYTTGCNTGPGTPATNPEPEQAIPTFTPSSRYFVALDWLEVTWHSVWFSPNAETLPSNYTSADVRHRTPAQTQRLSFNVPITSEDGKKDAVTVELLNNKKISGPKSKHYQTGLHVLFVPSGAKRTANQRAEVDTYGFGFISVSPNEGNNCKPGSAIFQAYNPVLYRQDLWTAYNAVQAALGASHGHFTRIDVCIDTRKVIEPYNAYWLDYHSYQFDHNHTRKYAMMGKVKIAESPLVEAGKVSLFHHGNAGSAKSLKGYCKGVRVYEENKLYIVEAWKRAGLIGPNDEGRDIERLEITLRRDGIKALAIIDKETAELSEAFNPAILDQPGVLAGIFKATCKGWFEIAVVNPSDKNKSRWQRVEVINWDELETAPIIRIPKTVNPSEVWRAKHASYKLARDCKIYTYPEAAVRRYLNSVPSYTVDPATVFDYSNRITAVIKGRGNGLSVGTILQDFAASLNDGIAVHLGDWSAKELPTHLAEAMAQYHGVGGYLERRLRKDVYTDPKDWTTTITGATGAGFPFLTTAPATCDASTKGFPDPIKLTEGMGLVKGQPLPKTTDLQSMEPGNKKGMLDVLSDGPIVSPQTMAQ
jgi:hypothetical protein